jgi:ribosomal protein S18 acetylase RimI-like enzyme
MLIRDFEPRDVERIVEIAVAAWEPIYAYYRQTMGQELFEVVFPDWQTEKAGQVRRSCLPQSSVQVCVAEVDGLVVGFITFYAHEGDRVGTIGNNAVHPQWQGQGIGPDMYEHVFARLRDLGFRAARVSTGGDPSHAPARRAYEKAGFDVPLPEVTYYRKL